MKKQNVSSAPKGETQEQVFNTVEQAFAHYFPRDKKTAPRAEGRESGAELAERVFRKIINAPDKR
jgi:hypothetical protein